MLPNYSSISNQLFKRQNLSFFIRGNESNIQKNLTQLDSFLNSFHSDPSYEDQGLGKLISSEGDRYVSSYDVENPYYQYQQSMKQQPNLFFKKNLNINYTSTVCVFRS